MATHAAGASRGVLRALVRAAPVFLSWRVFALVVVPLLGAAVFWGLVSWFAWRPMTAWIGTTLFDATTGWGAVAGAVLAALVLMLAAALTVLVAIAVLAMPLLVDLVARRDYPLLAKRRGGTFAGSLANAVTTIAWFLPLWIASLFTLFIPPVYIVVSLLLNAWLSQRLFRYDALAAHADGQELRDVIRTTRGRLFMLGLTLAPLSLVPFVNLVAPLYGGIAFTYLCLDALAVARTRTTPL